MSALATRLPGAGTLALALVLALVVIAALMWVMRRYPDAFPLLAVFALPFRLPISTGGRTVNLLIPLYLVVAAGTLEYLLPRLLARGTPQARERTSREPAAPGRLAFWSSPRGVEWLLFAAVGVYALQTLYSGDRTKAAENIAFFYVPFALLFLILRDVRWTRRLLLRCLALAVALAVLFAGVGFIEYYRKSLFLNPKVVAANQYDNYFRVNSVFFDPSIYGRFLALVMVALAAAVLARGASAYDRLRRRDVLVGGAVLLWLLAGLVTSFSQSSIAALVLGLWVLGAWYWSVRGAVYVALAALALAAVVVLLAPAGWHLGLKGSSGGANNATSGRASLVSGGLELFAQRPLRGIRRRLLRNRVQARTRRVRRRERRVRFAHDSGDCRRRAGDHRPGAVRGAPGQRLRGPVSRRRSLATADRDRRVFRRPGPAHVDVRGLPRRPHHVAAARDRPRAGPRRRRGHRWLRRAGDRAGSGRTGQ